MPSIEQPRYFMRDCRRLTYAGRFWGAYLVSVTVFLSGVIAMGYAGEIERGLSSPTLQEDASR